MARALDLPEPFFALGEQIGIDLPGSRAVFTTRRGGVSSGPYASLNLGTNGEDPPANFDENVRRIQSDHGVKLVWSPQAHGIDVGVVGASEVGARTDPVDGRATAERGVAPMVRTADCLAIALAADGAVAVVHAGWRGLAGGVIAEGARVLQELGGGGITAAAIGPAAGPCCYEVGEEVHEVFAGYGAEVRRGRNLDLNLVARRQLEAAGAAVVHDVGLCTICSDPALFFSHRRDHGVTGRQAGIAWLT